MTAETTAPAPAPAAASAPPASDERRRTVEAVDGARLAAYVQGPQDAPVTLVLVHGWALDATSWRAQADALSRPGGAALPVRTVRYDQRGHGRSEAGSAPWSIDQLGDDLLRLLDELAPSGPVVLGGHSMGGMTVLALAAARPELFGERVRGVLLTNTSAGDLDLTLHPELPWSARMVCRTEKAFFGYLTRTAVRSAWIRDHVLPGPTRKVSLALYRRLLFGPDASPAGVRHATRMIHECPMTAVGGWFPALMAHEKSDALAALAELPVEILVGALDKLTPVVHARRIAAALPKAHLHIEPRTGHMLQLEQPRLVTGRLRALCERAAATATE